MRLQWFYDEDVFCGACGQMIGTSDCDVWHRFFRLIIVDHADNTEVFTLSGIGTLALTFYQTPEREWLYIPREKNQVTLDAHNAGYPGAITSDLCTIYPMRYWTSQNCGKYPHGYPFHAKCWELVERCLSLSNPVQLEHLIIAIRKYWYNNNYDLDKYMPLRSYTCPWVPFVCYNLMDAAEATWPFEVNPFDIPEINGLIKHSTRRYSTRVKAKTKLEENYLSLLPFELFIRIQEYLGDVEVQNCATALGSYIPESYWRQRLGGLIFELTKVPSDVKVDWKFAYFETQKLTKRILGLENRQRIWKALKSIRAIFHTLGRQESSSLSVFINETYPIFTGPVDPGLEYWKKHDCAKPFPHTRFVKGDPPTDEPCECERSL